MIHCLLQTVPGFVGIHRKEDFKLPPKPFSAVLYEKPGHWIGVVGTKGCGEVKQFDSRDIQQCSNICGVYATLFVISGRDIRFGVSDSRLLIECLESWMSTQMLN